MEGIQCMKQLGQWLNKIKDQTLENDPQCRENRSQNFHQITKTKSKSNGIVR